MIALPTEVLVLVMLVGFVVVVGFGMFDLRVRRRENHMR